MNIRLLLLFIFLSVFTSCSEKKEPGKEASATVDTLNVGLGYPIGIIKNDDLYYALYRNYPNGREDFENFEDRFYIFNDEGKILHESASLIKNDFLVSSDLFAYNNRIYLKDKLENRTGWYWNKRTGKWVVTELPDNVVYQDSEWEILSEDFGEWGGRTWFRSRHSGEEHIVPAYACRAYKIANVYYLITYDEILTIADPKALEVAKPKGSYKNFKNDLYTFEIPDYYYASLDTLYAFNNENEEFATIQNAYVYKDTLRLAVTDNNGNTFLASLNNKTLDTIRAFKNVYPINYHEASRGDRMNNTRLFYSRVNGTIKIGIMEFDGTEVYLHYIRTDQQK